ncbi:MAG: hypothetical protein HZA54_08125 [Planctomycetes bacterium]|nr:hypothetical protein [Planctomycetota bacterium]
MTRTESIGPDRLAGFLVERGLIEAVTLTCVAAIRPPNPEAQLPGRYPAYDNHPG